MPYCVNYFPNFYYVWGQKSFDAAEVALIYMIDFLYFLAAVGKEGREK